jgi:hypothetical protein
MFTPLSLFILITVASLPVAALRLRALSWNVLDPTVIFWLGYAVYYGLANAWWCWEISRSGFLEVGGASFNGNSRDVEDLCLVASLTVAYESAVEWGYSWRALGSGGCSPADSPATWRMDPIHGSGFSCRWPHSTGSRSWARL